ncbi:MAG: PD-(D/E)XK nuclease family protein, partial [bacterium]
MIVLSPDGSARLAAAEAFVDALPAGAEVLVVGAGRQAVDDFARRVARPRRAVVGLHRFTLTQLAARLAAPALSAAGLAPCPPLAAHAVAARATFDALAAGAIPFFAPVARTPGFSRTLATTVGELREAHVAPQTLAAASAPGDEVARLLTGYAAQLDSAQLADRAALLSTATAAVTAAAPDGLIGLPLLLLDVSIASSAEATLVAALRAAASQSLATVAAGDERTLAAWRRLGAEAITELSAQSQGSLGRLQTYLFVEADPPPPGADDDAVRIFSAPGEGREAVEIARAARVEAAAGTPFDEMIVALRAPEGYTALLESAFRRAGVPAYFARGVRRPNPAGRAFLALLACAAEDLSAARFAEYLSLAQVPRRVGGDVAPWSPPRDDMVGGSASSEEAAPPQEESAAETEAAIAAAAPWKWEALLTDAAVIGGAARWARRIDGLARELALRADELAADDPEAPRLNSLARQRAQLDHLREFALPVIERLAALPPAATWGEWLERLRDLAAATLQTPQPVLAVLAELAPMSAVGPAGLDEVRDVLAER